MNPDTRRKINRYVRDIVFEGASALADHLDERYSASRQHVDTAIAVSILCLTLLARTLLSKNAHSEVEVSSDVKE